MELWGECCLDSPVVLLYVGYIDGMMSLKDEPDKALLVSVH